MRRTPGIQRQQQRERSGSPAEAKISAEGDPHTLDMTELALDRVQVEERLRRMFARTVTGVHHRDRRNGRRARRRALLVVAQHDHVGVRRHHADGVLERLALDGAGERARGLRPDHGSPEAEHRRLEAQACPRARFVEERRHDAVRQAVVANVRKGGGAPEEDVEQVAIELLG